LPTAVADSVAATLDPADAARNVWMDTPARWDQAVVEPFLMRVRAALGIEAAPSPDVRRTIALRLAARVVEVRWGADERQAFELRHDVVVQHAKTQVTQLPNLLAPPDN